ncbi:MAG: low molecular weight protein-tyrosine-phosphatase [Bacteroidales bacterium]
MKILFVCLGNICRSPMAEAIFAKMIHEQELSAQFKLDSAGLHGYHEGERADSRMRRHAQKRGYEIVHRSRPIVMEDFERFDLIIGMDEQNMRALQQLASSKGDFAKLSRMTDYCQHIDVKEVPDPYYGGDEGFERVIDILEDACEGLLEVLVAKGNMH